MAEFTRRGVLALGAAAVAASRLIEHSGAVSHKPAHRSWLRIPPRQLIQQQHLPNVPLRTHLGARVHFYDDLVKDKKVVLNFMFTECEKACPKTTANLVRLQERLSHRIGHDIFLYSITLRPTDDTPAALKHYAEMYGVGPGWLFLTGKPGDIELLRRSLGFVSSSPRLEANKSYHVGMLRYGNEPYMRWAACPGQANVEWIATSILAEMDGPLRESRMKNSELRSGDSD